MLVFNCTKAALKFFSSLKDKKKFSPEQPKPKFDLLDKGSNKNPISQWSLQCAEIEGHTVVFACHSHFRFVMAYSHMENRSWQHFIQTFLERYLTHIEIMLEEYAVGIRLTPEHRNKVKALYFPPYACARYNPSTQSMLNEAAYHFNYVINEIDDFPTEQEEVGFDKALNSIFTYSKSEQRELLPCVELLIDFLVTITDFDSNMVDNIREDLINTHIDINLEEVEFMQGQDAIGLPELLAAIENEPTAYKKHKKKKQQALPENVISLEQARKKRQR